MDTPDRRIVVRVRDRVAAAAALDVAVAQAVARRLPLHLVGTYPQPVAGGPADDVTWVARADALHATTVAARRAYLAAHSAEPRGR